MVPTISDDEFMNCTRGDDDRFEICADTASRGRDPGCGAGGRYVRELR